MLNRKKAEYNRFDGRRCFGSGRGEGFKWNGNRKCLPILVHMELRWVGLETMPAAIFSQTLFAHALCLISELLLLFLSIVT